MTIDMAGESPYDKDRIVEAFHNQLAHMSREHDTMFKAQITYEAAVHRFAEFCKRYNKVLKERVEDYIPV